MGEKKHLSPIWVWRETVLHRVVQEDARMSLMSYDVVLSCWRCVVREELQGSRAAPGAQQPSGGREVPAQDPTVRHGHTWLPGKGMKDELRWERRGCRMLKETYLSSDLLADASLIIAVLKVKQLVNVGGEDSELEYR